MDFRFTNEQEEFRQEVRRFLDEELPPDWTGLGGWIGFGGWRPQKEEDYAIHRTFERKLAEKGWLTMAWPKEYGVQVGTAGGRVCADVFAGGREYHRAGHLRDSAQHHCAKGPGPPSVGNVCWPHICRATATPS
jgi:alkylation response protein AidB-like acyl-CoA dehydrogenase